MFSFPYNLPGAYRNKTVAHFAIGKTDFDKVLNSEVGSKRQQLLRKKTDG